MKKSKSPIASNNIKEIEETPNKEEKSFSDTEKSNDIQSEVN